MRGRPSDYDRKYIKEVDLYLQESKDDYQEVLKQRAEFMDAKGGATNQEIKERKLIVKLPTVEGFALRIGVNKTTLYEWEKKHPFFSNALEKIRVEQKTRLLNMGLSGEYNSTIAKLILSSNHGMIERQDVTTGGEQITGMVIKKDAN